MEARAASTSSAEPSSALIAFTARRSRGRHSRNFAWPASVRESTDERPSRWFLDLVVCPDRVIAAR
jgi:hypothetical protein